AQLAGSAACTGADTSSSGNAATIASPLTEGACTRSAITCLPSSSRPACWRTLTHRATLDPNGQRCQAALGSGAVGTGREDGSRYRMGLTPISDIRRRELKQAAFEVLKTEGVHGATLEKVARRAGASKGIVLHYFLNKQQLFSQTMRYANALL